MGWGKVPPLLILIVGGLALRVILFTVLGEQWAATCGLGSERGPDGHVGFQEAAALDGVSERAADELLLQREMRFSIHDLGDRLPQSGNIWLIPPLVVKALKWLGCDKQPWRLSVVAFVLSIGTSLLLADVALLFNSKSIQGTAQTRSGSRLRGEREQAEGSGRQGRGETPKVGAAQSGKMNSDVNNPSPDGNRKRRVGNESDGDAADDMKDHIDGHGGGDNAAAAAEEGDVTGYDREEVFGLKEEQIPGFVVAAAYCWNPLVVYAEASLSLRGLHHAAMAAVLWSCSVLSVSTTTTRGAGVIFGPLSAVGASSFLMYLSPIGYSSSLISVGCTAYAACFPRQARSPKPAIRRVKDVDDNSAFSLREVVPCACWVLVFCGSAVVGFLVLHVFANPPFVTSRDEPWTYFRESIAAAGHQESLNPTLSVWWYLQTLIFDRFRLFFRMAFEAFPFALSLPVICLFYRSPLTAATLSQAIVVFLSPCSHVADFAYLVAVLLTDFEIFSLAGGFFFQSLGSLVSIMVFAVSRQMWLSRNTGNANFVFVFQLIYFLLTGHIIATWMGLAFQRQLQLPRTRPATSSKKKVKGKADNDVDSATSRRLFFDNPGDLNQNKKDK